MEFRDDKPKTAGRLTLLCKVAMALFIILAVRLLYMQIIKAPEYKKLSRKNSIRLVRLRAPRGEIKDTNGKVLATNEPRFDVMLFRAKETNFPYWEKLMTQFHEDKNLSDFPAGKFALLKKNVTWEQLCWAEERKDMLPALSIQIHPKRRYPFNERGCHFLGYVGETTLAELKCPDGKWYHKGDFVGKSGVEKTFDRHLRGESGGKQIVVDARGYPTDVVGSKNPVKGTDLPLTIDWNLQKTAELAMGKHSGAIIIMNPRDGSILSLVSKPEFDPNIFTRPISHLEWKKLNESKHSVFTNRAIQGEYPPASTFKLVLAMAALEEGLIDLNTKFVCTGSYAIGNRNFKCWKSHGHGAMNLTEAIVHSCDIFFYKLGLRLGPETIARYAGKFGLGKPTGVSLPGEEKGFIPTPRWKKKTLGTKWYPGDTANMSIGQGFVLVTPIQLANMYCTFANGGTIFRPRLCKQQPTEPIRNLSLKANTLAVLKNAFTEVVSSGTGYRSKIAEIEVAGKTGTSQNPHGDDHALFVAFAPVENPDICVCVIMENAGHGSSQAAPVCAKILKEYFRRK